MNLTERQIGDYTVVELTGRLTVNDDPGRLRVGAAGGHLWSAYVAV